MGLFELRAGAKRKRGSGYHRNAAKATTRRCEWLGERLRCRSCWPDARGFHAWETRRHEPLELRYEPSNWSLGDWGRKENHRLNTKTGRQCEDV